MLQKYSFTVLGLILAIGTLATAMPSAMALPGQIPAEQAPSSSPASTVYAVPDASEVFMRSIDNNPHAIQDLSMS